jgi:ribonuclease E
VHGGLPLEVAYYLLNRKKRELTQIENDYEIEVTVKGKTSYLLNQLELETVKRDIPRPEDQAKSEAEAEEAHKPVKPVSMVEKVADKAVAVEQPVEGAVTTEGAKKRKRRRKKKKGAGDAAGAAEQIETAIAAVEQPVPGTESAVDTDDSEDSTEGVDESIAKPKKRKRRRGRKGPKVGGEAVAESAALLDDGAVPPAIETVTPPPVVEMHDLPLAADKPKRPRPARAKKKPAVDEVADIPVPAAQVVVDEPAPTPKPRRRAAPKKVAAVELPPAAVPEEKTKPVPRARRKKKEEDGK